MTLVLEVPEDLEKRLTSDAEREGISTGEYALRLLRESVSDREIRTGAELVEYWKREGLIGTRPDITDSASHARQLRDLAETRTRP